MDYCGPITERAQAGELIKALNVRSRSEFALVQRAGKFLSWHDPNDGHAGDLV
jgi:hypothetical protein